MSVPGAGWGAVRAKKAATRGGGGAEGDENPEGPAVGAFAGGGVFGSLVAVGAGEEAADHEGECGEGGEGVVLLTGGESEEAEDEGGPKEQGDGGFVPAGDGWGTQGQIDSGADSRCVRGQGSPEEDPTLSCPTSEAGGDPFSLRAARGWGTRVCGARSFGAEVAEVLSEGSGEEGGPGEEPDEGEGPEEGDGDLAVVVGDAAGEEAGDVLVVEVEPGPATVGGEFEAGGEGYGGVAEGGEDVPGGGEGEEGCGGCEGVEASQGSELAGEGEVEEDEADGEDEADEAFGEDVEGHDGGEGEHGREGGVSQRFCGAPDPTLSR